MKKWIILCALAAASLCALAACDAAPPSEMPSAGQSEQATVPQEPPGLRLSVNEKQGDSIIEIPEFVAPGDNPEIDSLNAKIYENHTKLYEEWKKAPNSVRGLEIKSELSFANEEYVQAVVTQLEFPTYGTQGDIFSYNYDVKNQKAITLEEFLPKLNRSPDDLLGAITFNLPNNITVSHSELQGFRIISEVAGMIDCFAKVYFTDTSGQTEDYNMLYIIHLDNFNDTLTAEAYNGQLPPLPRANPSSSTTSSENSSTSASASA